MTGATALGALAAVLVTAACAMSGVRVAPGPNMLPRRPPPNPGSVRLIVAALVGLALAGPVGACMCACGILCFERLHRRRAGRQRAAALREQLPDGVASIAASLRGGGSVRIAIDAAARETEAPLRPALQAVTRAIEKGASLDRALEELEGAGKNRDARLVTGVIGMRRLLGDGLPGVLDGVVATLRERLHAEQEIRSLTAQARLSGLVVGLLPIGFFGVLLLISPGDIAAAYATPLGAAAIIGGLVLEVLGFVWIRSLLRVDA